MKKLGLLICAAIIGMAFISCGSNKEVAQTQTKECQCLSTKDAFRAEGSFLAQYETMEPKAKQNAANRARQELASMMSATIERVIDEYSNTEVVGDKQDFRETTKELSRTIVKQVVKNSVPAIPGWSEKKETGTMFFVCLESNPNELLEQVSQKISQNEKLRTDFEYEKFKETFEKALESIDE